MVSPRFPKLFMFSGLGAQYYHMGRELFESDSAFRDSMQEMDELVRAEIGLSVLRILFDDARSKADAFERTLLSCPATVMVECALARTLLSQGIAPQSVLGVSLGTFAAAYVAGCWTVHEAIRTSINLARIVESYCTPGCMLAIFSCPELYVDAGLDRYCEIAAIDLSSHFVVAAEQRCLEPIEAIVRQHRVISQRLPVRYAFHSRWIDPAKLPLIDYFRGLFLKPAQIPFVCCATATLLESLPQEYFWTVMRQPIRFSDAVAMLENIGPYTYIDAGPSASLATFLKYTLPARSQSQIVPTLSAFGNDLGSVQRIANWNPAKLPATRPWLS